MTSLPLCMLLLAAGLAYAASSKPYVVEVYFVVDPEAVKRYQGFGYTSESEARKQLEKEFNNNIEEVNKFYKSMNKYDLYIEIRVKHLQFAKDQVYSGTDLFNGNSLTTDVSLEKFQKYLTDKKINGFDVAVVLTGFNLVYKDASDASGIANFKSACHGDGIGAIEVDGTHNTANTIAHEIAHTLGANHDATNGCSQEDGYIMSPRTGAKSQNRWSFSPCSRKEIVNYIIGLDYWKENCLLDTTAKPLVPTPKEKDPLDPEKICQRVVGKDSFMCKKPDLYKGEVKGDRVCMALWCDDASHPGSCTSKLPSEGMICDVGKRCSQGKCVTAEKTFPTPEDIDTNCVFGDTRSHAIFRNYPGTCAEIIKKKNGRDCYKSMFNTQCCASCKKVYTGIPGCAYGDKASWCTSDTKESICVGDDAKTCCKTCHGFTPRGK